ncbi:hypothetical protein VNO78_04888 [Psophocarpus tetragonolobus]|uniref:50S ribosomal protein L18 n=1 Tax=Psophocarpus tetragonolobus TaxID=3891 RepID=A0AAN9ST43_PSOTE
MGWCVLVSSPLPQLPPSRTPTPTLAPVPNSLSFSWLSSFPTFTSTSTARSAKNPPNPHVTNYSPSFSIYSTYHKPRLVLLRLLAEEVRGRGSVLRMVGCSLGMEGIRLSYDSFIRAAWTRRSRGEAAKKPNRKSWKQRTDMYMRPFLLNVFFSKRFIHAKVVHRGTSKVICVATTNAKDLRNSLPSLIDHNACRVVGRLIAERSMDADVYAVAYEPRKDERIEGRLGIVLDTIKENGIIFV